MPKTKNNKKKTLQNTKILFAKLFSPMAEKEQDKKGKNNNNKNKNANSYKQT